MLEAILAGEAQRARDIAISPVDAFPQSVREAG